MHPTHQPTASFNYVPTWTLIGYLAAVLAWEAEIAVLLLHIFAHQRMTIVEHVIIAVPCGVLSLFAWWRHRDFQALRHTRGKIPITALQGFIITAFLLTAVFFAVWIGNQIFD